MWQYLTATVAKLVLSSMLPSLLLWLIRLHDHHCPAWQDAAKSRTYRKQAAQPAQPHTAAAQTGKEGPEKEVLITGDYLVDSLTAQSLDLPPQAVRVTAAPACCFPECTASAAWRHQQLHASCSALTHAICLLACITTQLCAEASDEAHLEHTLHCCHPEVRNGIGDASTCVLLCAG